MGFHVCEYCQDETSSGHVRVSFSSGRTWEMPDMILHYVADHDFRPPDEFMKDVLSGHVTSGGRYQTKSLAEPTKVGFLSGPFDTWGGGHSQEKGEFFMALWGLLRKAERSGSRSQTRGAVPPHPGVTK